MSEAISDQKLQNVIAKAYAAIAKPDDFVDLISELANAEEEFGGLALKSEGHLLNAAQIIETMYPVEDGDYRALNTKQNQDIDCDLALDKRLTVLTVNDSIFETGDLTRGSLVADWLFDTTAGSTDVQRLKGIKANESAAFFRLYVNPQDHTGRWFSVTKHQLLDDVLTVFRAVRLRWSERTGAAFKQALKLTDTELMLTRHLVTGGKVREFAEHRNRAIGTVRNQLKALQRKLSINSKEELLLLYAGFVHSIELPNENELAGFHECSRVFTDASGHSIAWEEHGDLTGIPVLYFHPLEGALLTPVVERAAFENGLRIIAPWRPYYGQTSGEDRGIKSAKNFPERVAKLLDHLGIDRCLAFASQAGGPFLMAMAKGQPSRITSAVCVGSFLPVSTSDDFGHLPKKQRLQMRLARIAPSFARIYQKAMVASMRTGDFYRFVEEYFQDCPQELITVGRPDLVAMFRNSATYAISLGFEGTTDTMLNWSADWSVLCRDLTVPVHVLAGELDRTTVPEFVDLCAKKYGFEHLQFISGAGSFLLHEEPDLVMKYLREQS